MKITNFTGKNENFSASSISRYIKELTRLFIHCFDDYIYARYGDRTRGGELETKGGGELENRGVQLKTTGI